MKPINIYRSLILPDITDFCQNFFPSLVEQSYEENKEPPNALKRTQVNDCTQLFMSWLNRALSFDEQPLKTTVVFCLQNQSDASEAQRLNQYLTYATSNKFDTHNNPLAPNNIVSALIFCIEETTPKKAASLIDHLKSQFDAVAFGFYKKLNAICGSYFDKCDIAEEVELQRPPFPPTTLTDNSAEAEPNTFPAESSHSLKSNQELESNQKTSPPPSAGNVSIENAEKIINQIKDLYKVHVTRQTENIRADNLAKRLQVPLINYAISSPDLFVQPQYFSHITQLIITISTVRSLDDADLNSAEIIVANFIACINERNVDIEKTTAELANLTKNKHKSNASLSSTHNVVAENRPNTTAPSKYSANDSLPKSNNNDIQKQAKIAIDNLLDGQNPSVANQLQNDWSIALIATGQLHGYESIEWRNCLDTFKRLMTYQTFNEVPLSLLYKAEAQLQFAGVSSHGLDSNTAPRMMITSEVFTAKEGSWFEYDNGTQIMRCKLAAIIKQIGLYIFISRHGKKILEVNQDLLNKYIASGVLKPLESASVSKTLEDILSSIKNAQSAELCES